MDQYAEYLNPAQKEQGYAKMNCPPKVRHRTFGGQLSPRTVIKKLIRYGTEKLKSEKANRKLRI